MNDAADPVVIGILYPTEWYAQGIAAEVAALEAFDPRIEVVASASYSEPHELRTARRTGADLSTLPVPPIDPDLAEVLARAHVVVAIDLPPNTTELAPNLRWVQAVGAGTSQLQIIGLGAAGVRLTSNGGANGVAIAEFVLGRIIQWAKRFDEIAELQKEHRWDPLYGIQLAGMTIGLVGYGGINEALAIRAGAFDMRVLAMRRTKDAAAEPPVDRFFGPDQLLTMLPECDMVVAAVPDTPETEGMFDATAFAAMRPGSYFVNVGRGPLVDEQALRDALASGQLAGAALDVASREPLPPDDPLWDTPNLHISGHCSSAPQALFPNVHRVFRDNLRRFLDGEPLRHEVAEGRGY